MDAALLELKRAADEGDAYARMRYEAECARAGVAPKTHKIAFDSETALWREGYMVPSVACWTWAERAAGASAIGVGISTRSCIAFRSTIETILREDTNTLIIGHNVAYELTGIVNEFPELTSRVWRLLMAGKIHDTSIRERILNLATHGKLDMAPNLDGSWSQQTYSLAELEKNYAINFGVDRKAEKTDEDAWRNHYEILLNVPLAMWPAEAVEYAKRDAHGTLLVHDAQDDRAQSLRGYLDGRDPLAVEGEQVAAAFALRLSGVWGMACDFKKRDEIAKQLQEELAPERVWRLIQTGILIPPVPPRLRKNGTMTKGDPDEHIKQAPLHELVTKVCTAHGIKIKRTETGKVSTDKEVMENIAGLDETLDEYRHRQQLQKLKDEIGRMTGPVIYTRYDVLKETGRTSSKAEEGIPSSNIQNKPQVKKLKDKSGKERGEINIRNCYVARRREFGFSYDTVLCSADYLSLEFVSMAQTCYRLFGYSVMRDLLNSGVDPHAYLAGQLALHLDPWFRDQCVVHGIASDKEKVYHFFKAFERNENKQVVEFYEKYRKLAKPVGFGYPGGLGAKKFISFAKAQYDVTVTQEEAEILKEIWFSTYHEMEDYFNWINNECVDPNNEHTDEETGQRRRLYRYVTHKGLVRAGATYTAACNGALLQAPAAEGAKLAVIEVQRECYDPEMSSVLYGCRMVAFVHDEIILEIPDDGDVELRHRRAHRLSEIMVRAMKTVMPDLIVKAVPCLQYRWDKKAKEVLDARGFLDVWRPKEIAA